MQGACDKVKARKNSGNNKEQKKCENTLLARLAARCPCWQNKKVFASMGKAGRAVARQKRGGWGVGRECSLPKGKRKSARGRNHKRLAPGKRRGKDNNPKMEKIIENSLAAGKKGGAQGGGGTQAREEGAWASRP